MLAFGGVSSSAALGLLVYMHAKTEPLELLEISLTRPNDHSTFAPKPHKHPSPTQPTANMEGDKYSASLIRLWRVWKTTKEMMNDRVGCACALSNAGLRADSIKGLHGA